MVPTNVDATPEARLFDQKLVLWKELRSAISHEDDLVHQRSTWLLTFEGFLMGGFFVGQTAILGAHTMPHRRMGELFLLFLLLGGLWICVVTAQTISAAHAQVGILREFWLKRYAEESWARCKLRPWWRFDGETVGSTEGRQPAACQFPPLHGEFYFGPLGGMTKIPIVLFLVNLLAVFGCMLLMIWG